MKSKKSAIALIFGGMGKEHSVSVSGAPYLYSLIDKDKFNVIPLLIKEDGTMIFATISDGGNITESESAAHLFRMFGRGGVVIEGDFTPLAAAIPHLHGDFGEDGTVQGALTLFGIPYIGCDTGAGAVCLDKIYTKILAEHLGIPVAKYRYFILEKCDSEELSRTAEDIEKNLGYPVIIKPARLGSSIGISCARCKSELIRAIKHAFSTGEKRILAEELLNVRLEAECASFITEKAELFTSPGTVRVADGFYDYEKKYLSKCETEISPESNLFPEESELIKKYSKILSDLVGIRHLSRIDFFLTEDGKIIFNEINTFPGFTSDSLYPKLIERAGISPADAINLMLCEVTEL